MKKKTLILILLLITFIFAQEWVARYNGPGNSYDEAKAIAVDNNGNVYVTGRSYGHGTDYDYATIKYNSNGQQLWVTRYNGPGNNWDVATAIAVDNNGNVYVTGYSVGTASDYATIKYNSNGQEEWVRRYNGPVNSDDYATAIAVDNNGNVYVTGYSYNDYTSYDYATIKYNSEGQVVWVARYNGPGNGRDVATAIAVDNNGNVYVTGYSYNDYTSYDYATIKYNSDGQELWVRRYNGPGNGADSAKAIAVDNNGNVYVTGYSVGDYATIKYNSNGQQLWVAEYNGPGNGADEATAIAVDNNGNVYVTGWSWGQGTYFDYATIKYNSNGQAVWVARYNGPGNGSDWATAIAVDNNGNVYVTGRSYREGTYYNFATIKYNSNGQQLWVARYDGRVSWYEGARAIAVDNNGNVYVTGGSEGDYATIKYNSNGQAVWVARYNGPANFSDEARAIAVGNNGNVYVTGGSCGHGIEDYDYATIKYSAVGIEEKENKPILKSNLPKENLKIYNILGKEVNSSKNLKPGIYFIETKEKSKRKIVIVR
jgi:uncharacterized delta-60 repeat protein